MGLDLSNKYKTGSNTTYLKKLGKCPLLLYFPSAINCKIPLICSNFIKTLYASTSFLHLIQLDFHSYLLIVNNYSCIAESSRHFSL